MGLAYVQTLGRRHGGDIACQSTLGEGTTFTFTIAQARPDRSLEQ
jgi:two-component system sensor histidine kinase/response regulator